VGAGTGASCEDGRRRPAGEHVPGHRIADPNTLVTQDGPEPHDLIANEVTGDEKAVWWERAVAAYPPYGEYQAATTRVIPVFVARRADA